MHGPLGSGWLATGAPLGAAVGGELGAVELIELGDGLLTGVDVGAAWPEQPATSTTEISANQRIFSPRSRPLE
jgi:hypothetical protein